MTREEWLGQMVKRLRPLFSAAGYPLPAAIRVSCGWPSHRALASPTAKSRTTGQCWPTECSADGSYEIFVSPAIAAAADVAAILTHELVHAALDCEHGHLAPFRRAAIKLGLTGKMTQTTAGPELAERLNALAAELGDYPHATLDQAQAQEPKQGTRLIKVICPDCGYTIRTTRQWLDTGLPTCPCGTEMEE